jgi:hypothetical protein
LGFLFSGKNYVLWYVPENVRDQKMNFFEFFLKVRDQKMHFPAFFFEKVRDQKNAFSDFFLGT